jgi:4-amino-4-deoxy-L-arabinose transferase-like glycosyltransferase
LVIVAMALATTLRAIDLGRAPPVLNQDEAINAWNAWCLLKSGCDMVGAHWPIFYARAIGESRTTLYFYVLLPFQWLGGLNVWTTRLPALLGGVLSVPLIAFVGARLFDRRVGLVAALLFATNPWNLFLGRVGFEGSLCPVLALIPLALMIAAGLPLGDRERTARPVLGLLAGLAGGVVCYGYWAMRLYVPALVLALGASMAWRGSGPPRSRASLAVWLAMLAGFVATFGPLAWKHVSDPLIARRAEMTRLWEAGTPLGEIASRVLARFAMHFGGDFLFLRGDHFEIVNPLRAGAFSWFALPLLLAGLVAVIARVRASRSARTLAALLLVYPAGDVISAYDGVHTLRAAPGVPTLVLLAALGAVASWRWIRARSQSIARAVVGVAMLSWLWLDGGFALRFVREFDRAPNVYHAYQEDLVQAVRWLKPRWRDYDAIYCTTNGTNEPFSLMLFGLGYEPHRWFAEPRVMGTVAGWDAYSRFGRFHFLYRDLWHTSPAALGLDATARRSLFIVRPGELGLANPAFRVLRPDGTEVLWLCERGTGATR